MILPLLLWGRNLQLEGAIFLLMFIVEWILLMALLQSVYSFSRKFETITSTLVYLLFIISIIPTMVFNLFNPVRAGFILFGGWVLYIMVFLAHFLWTKRSWFKSKLTANKA